MKNFLSKHIKGRHSVIVEHVDLVDVINEVNDILAPVNPEVRIFGHLGHIEFNCSSKQWDAIKKMLKQKKYYVAAQSYSKRKGYTGNELN